MPDAAVGARSAYLSEKTAVLRFHPKTVEDPRAPV
jgi:hypothetical protein